MNTEDTKMERLSESERQAFLRQLAEQVLSGRTTGTAQEAR